MTKILFSWLAVNNDPYERERNGQVAEPRRLGPTLTLLFDPESEFHNSIQHAIFLTQQDERTRNVLADTKKAIEELCRDFTVETHTFPGSDPTDHKAIYEFLIQILPEIRRIHLHDELIVHISPGTPSMQTVWVLMGETGMINGNFRLVKSYRRGEGEGQRVVSVNIGLETYYEAYKKSKPRNVENTEQYVAWDPAKFAEQGLLKNVYLQAKRFAALKTPILIFGERGTGKTTLANWIRSNSCYRSEKNDNSWPAVPCGQYSPELMRSELFGYTKGAFTGATRDKQGLLAIADGDTLFLDEIGDMSRDLQRLLIKAIEEKRFSPVGSDKVEQSDFRLICATNQPWTHLRECLDPDFLDRISLLTLELPPLRMIREELGWMWESAYSEAVKRSGLREGEFTRFDPATNEYVVKQLREREYPLNGNIRDLLKVAYNLIALVGTNEPSRMNAEIGELIFRLLHDDSGLRASPEAFVAKAFANGSGLDDFFNTHARLESVKLFTRFRLFLGTELRRIANQRDVLVDDICDVSERTLRNWVSTEQ